MINSYIPDERIFSSMTVTPARDPLGGALSELGKAVYKHEAQGNIAVFLLHQHNPLVEGNVWVTGANDDNREIGTFSAPLSFAKNQGMVPVSFYFQAATPNTTLLRPFEFAFPSYVGNRSLSDLVLVIGEIGDILASHGLLNTLGIALMPDMINSVPEGFCYVEDRFFSNPSQTGASSTIRRLVKEVEIAQRESIATVYTFRETKGYIAAQCTAWCPMRTERNRWVHTNKTKHQVARMPIPKPKWI